MKKLLLILLCLIAKSSMAQNPVPTPMTFNLDTFRHGKNAGAYFLEYLKSSTDSLRHPEASEENENERLLEFWMKRLPTGDSSRNPILQYMKGIKEAATMGHCEPRPGDFNGNWKNTGTKSGDFMNQGIVYAIYSPPNDPNTIFVGVSMGGLWKTTNANAVSGPDWTCISDDFLEHGCIGVRDLTVNPNNINEMVLTTQVTDRDKYGGYGQGMWYSTDGGDNWTLDLGTDIFAPLQVPALTPDPIYYSNELVEFAPFKLNNNTNQFLISVKNKSINKSVEISSKVGALTNGWNIINPPLMPPYIFSSLNDIEFETELGNKNALISFNESLENGIYSPGALYYANFDDNGNVTNWINISDLNDIHLFNAYYINNPQPRNAGTYTSTYIGNHKFYVAMIDADKILDANNNFVDPPWFNTVNRTAIYLLDVSNPLAPTWTFIQAKGGQLDYYGMFDIESSPTHPETIYLGQLNAYRIFPNPFSTIEPWQMETIGSATTFHADVRDVFIQNPNALPVNQNVLWGHDGGISKGNNQFNVQSINGNNFFTTQIVDIGTSHIKSKKSFAAMHNGGYSFKNNGTDWRYVSTGDGYASIYDKRTSINNEMVLHHGNGGAVLGPGSYDLHNQSVIGPLGVWNPPMSPEDFDRPEMFPHDFDVEQNLMYLGNTNMFESAPGSVDVWNRITGDNIGIFDIEKVGDHCRAIAVAPSKTEIKYYVLRDRPVGVAPGITEYPNMVYGYFNDPLSQTNKWQNITPGPVEFGFLPTDIIVDPMDPARIWLSLGGRSYANPPENRVLYSSDYGKNWGDMSTGLSNLPVIDLIYQKGSDDVIYAGTDDGVYRWDKPLGCWVKFNDGIVPNSKMPAVLVNNMEIDYCAGKLVVGSHGRSVWESNLYKPSADYGLASNFNIIITQNTLWDKERHVEGHVLVAGGATLTIKGTPDYVTNTSTTTIYMMKDGIIEVANGAKLILDGAKITNGCDEMWYGINVRGTTNFDQIYVPSSGLYIDHGYFQGKGGIIENAYEALNNFSPATATWSHGGVIKADNIHFENCRRSMQFMKFENPTFGKPDESKISNCMFNVNDNILTEFAYHISMWDVHNIPVTNCIFNNNQSIQTHHQKGFVSIDAEYLLSNSVLNNFVTGIESGAGLNGQNLNVEIKNNLFDGNQFGIDMYSITRGLQILNNEFKIGKLQYGYTGGGGFGYQTMGSNLRCNSNFVYNDNIHTLVYAAPTAVPFIYQHSIGTLINSSGDIDQPIIRNFYTDLLIGNQAIGTCGSNSFIVRGLNYLCNTNTNNNKYDFYLYWNTIVRRIQAANPLKATGNIFSQNTSVIHWKHPAGGNAPVEYRCNISALNEQPGPGSNTLTVLTSDIPVCTQINNILGNIGSADLANLKTQFATSNNLYTNYLTTYNALIDNGNTALTVNEIEDATLAQQMQLRSDLLATSPYLSEEALLSMVNENILTTAMQFEVIMANPDASKSEAFITFLEDEAPTPFPNYMINLIRGSWSGSSNRTLLETNLSTEYSIASSNREQILNYYKNDTLFRNEDSLITWLNKLPSIRDKYQLADYYLNKENYLLAQSTLESIPLQFKLSTQELYDYQSFVNFYNFKKNIIENDISLNKLDSTRISNLKDIAEIEKSTVARERARGILCFFYNLCYELDEEPEIQTKGKTITRKEEIQKDVEVYPNPAKDYVTFSFINASIACKDCIIKISDLQGRTIYTANLENAKQQHIWDTRKTNPGTYIYEIKSATKVWSGKIVVVK